MSFAKLTFQTVIRLIFAPCVLLSLFDPERALVGRIDTLQVASSPVLWLSYLFALL
jgi:hypothetical protein